jgi:hypothetical protein
MHERVFRLDQPDATSSSALATLIPPYPPPMTTTAGWAGEGSLI